MLMHEKKYTYPSDALSHRNGNMGFLAQPTASQLSGLGGEYLMNQMHQYTDAQGYVAHFFSDAEQGIPYTQQEASQHCSQRLKGSEVVGSSHRLAAEVDATLEQLRYDALGEKKHIVPQSPDAKLPKRPAGTALDCGSPAAGKFSKGLRHFSRQVVEKLSHKGRTTYIEVADELVREGKEQANRDRALGRAVPDDDEKNIRRRVYDALNVLKALGAIEQDEKKNISWIGFSGWQVNEITQCEIERDLLKSEVEKKNKHLKDLVDQYKTLCNLLKRNHEQRNNQDSLKIALPFVIVQTNLDADVQVDISDDYSLAHFNFKETEFEIHDDTFVLKQLGLCGSQPNRASASGSGPRTPALSPQGVTYMR